MTQIQLRRDVAANWEAANPILAQGEIGVNLTNQRFKLGDGTTAWKELAYYDEFQIAAEASGKADYFLVDNPLSMNIISDTAANISSSAGGEYQYLNDIAYNVTKYSPVIQASGASVTLYATSGTSTTEYPKLLNNGYLKITRAFEVGDIISGLMDRRADTGTGTFAPMCFGFLSGDGNFEPKIIVDVYNGTYRTLALSGSPKITHPTSSRTVIQRTMSIVQNFTGESPVDQLRIIAGDDEGTFYFEMRDENGTPLRENTHNAQIYKLADINCALYQAKCYSTEPAANSIGFKAYNKTYVKNIAGETVWSLGAVTKDKHLGLRVSAQSGNSLQVKTDGLYVATSDVPADIVTKSNLSEIVDGQTIEVVDNKLTCNLDELGNEVNTLSRLVTSLQDSKQDKLTAGDNITITEDGTISAVSSGSGASANATLLGNETDLNTIVSEGKYYAGGSNNCANRPTGVDAFGLVVLRIASDWYNQICFPSNQATNKIFIRTTSSATTPVWTDWVEVANKATTLSGYGITNAYTKTETDSKITAAVNPLTTAIGDFKFVKCTQAEYDAIETKDSSTLYVITG